MSTTGENDDPLHRLHQPTFAELYSPKLLTVIREGYGFDGFRADISLEALSKLRAVFKKDGSTTAGNSSQVSDGAAAVLLMRRSEAVKRGVPILGVFRSFAAVGVDPSVMGIGPAVAIPAAVKAAGLEINDIDLFEINEVGDSLIRFVFRWLMVPQLHTLILKPETCNLALVATCILDPATCNLLPETLKVKP